MRSSADNGNVTCGTAIRQHGARGQFLTFLNLYLNAEEIILLAYKLVPKLLARDARCRNVFTCDRNSSARRIRSPTSAIRAGGLRNSDTGIA